ncbi:hypothetical protein O6H91_23G029900 [Diphasiastrum complanatum]|uniref:Uncharacterized protein n=1 Tax=Diphasiastrum complanatum TaxID=34168 RepID=A0ACC2A990_DIPCM|nr:hypothetical protein O6H91_23G029900 [Diphasiastrum complanatum]
MADGDVITILVKHGNNTLQVSLPAAAKVRDLKEQLQHLTNVLPRGQKLIHKGKLLNCDATLRSANVGSGSKIMLLASQGIHQGPSPATSKPSVTNRKEKSDSLPSAPRHNIQKPSKNVRIQSWKTTGIVSLRDNDLQMVPSEVWSLGSSARVLDLSGNCLTDFSMSISSLTNLKRLCLSNCGLVDGVIHWESLLLLKSLSVLALDHNSLTSIPAEIGELSSLRQLLASHNKLTAVHDNIGNLQGLEKLELSNNCLSSVPSSLGDCLSLIEINLSCNFLKELPLTLGNLKSLQALLPDL